jgi:hypothetical protein
MIPWPGDRPEILLFRRTIVNKLFSMNGRSFRKPKFVFAEGFSPQGMTGFFGITWTRTSKQFRSIAAGIRGILDQRLQGLADSLHYSDMRTCSEGYVRGVSGLTKRFVLGVAAIWVVILGF